MAIFYHHFNCIMENKNNSTETITFKTPLGKVKLKPYKKTFIEVAANTPNQSYFFHLDFETKENRNGVFQIWSLKRAKDLLQYLNDREQ